MTILHTLYNEKFKSATLIFFCIFLGNINVEAQNAYSFFVAITSRKHLWAFQVVAGRHWAMAWAVADGLVGYEAVIELDTYPSSSILTSGRIFLSLSHQIQLAALIITTYIRRCLSMLPTIVFIKINYLAKIHGGFCYLGILRYLISINSCSIMLSTFQMDLYYDTLPSYLNIRPPRPPWGPLDNDLIRICILGHFCLFFKRT